MVNQQTLGGRIGLSRNARNLTTEQVAKRIGVKVSTLQNWENDRSEPRPSKLQMLAGVLKVPVLWLLAGNTMDEDFEVDIDVSETADIAAKLEQLHHHHQQTAKLIFELISDIRRLQRDIDDDVA